MERLEKRFIPGSHPPIPTEESAPRGILPRILLDYVANTAPFIFEGHWSAHGPTSYLARLARIAPMGLAHEDFTHTEYFTLCLSAHYATVATFVPTDVDNQIRHRLWHSSLPLTTLLEMADVVRESAHWDWSLVSTRSVRSPESGELLGGHGGEWFSVAVGAYCALRHRSPDDAKEVGSWILNELDRELRIVAELARADSGIGLCKASVLLAHNVGDLNRVFEMWAATNEDPLLAAITQVLAHSAVFNSASILNRDHMAAENHRHFTLRKPKCLRRSTDFLIGVGPFFDEWGERLAVHPMLSNEELAEIMEALIHGFQKLKIPAVGYARALAGIEQMFAGGLKEICSLLPARLARDLRSGALRQQISVPRHRFEAQWDHIGKRHFKP